MSAYSLPAGADDRIADGGRIYDIAFAYDGIVFYHNNDDYDDATNTIALASNGELLRGKVANDLLLNYIGKYVHENGPAYIADTFAGAVSYERREITEGENE